MSVTPVVRVFPRNQSEVLLRRSVHSPTRGSGRWTTVSGSAETGPERAARRALLTETGLSAGEFTLVRAGEPFLVTVDSERRRVTPFLFDCGRRGVTTGDDTTRAEWVPPTAMLSRETVPGLWESYDRVRPTVETVAGDTEHGSTWISIRALAVLRDEAGLAIHGRGAETAETDRADTDDHSPAAVARRLVAARPSMTAVVNRVHRVMAAAEEPADIASTAHGAGSRARRVDEEAATVGAGLLGERVATLSRSGTVLEALRTADPERLLVAESRPGREGLDVATTLAVAEAGPAVTVTTDAAFAAELADYDVETLVVGADTVLADGQVVNKAGTRSAALAATSEGIDVVVVTSSDKISPGTSYDPAERDPAEVYDGDASVAVANPTFDVTPPDAVDTVVTERGTLDPADIAEIATEHRSLREWQEQ